MRLIKQFMDGEKCTQPRETFSIQRGYVEEAKMLLSSMAQDLRQAAGQKGAVPPGASNAAQSQQGSSTPAAQSKLSEENLQNLNSSGGKHARSNSRHGPPAAPTSREPPFQIPSAPSPHGVPTYVNNSATAMDLTLPANKRRKHGPGSQSVGAGASPQPGKQASPDVKKVLAEPQFPCPEPDCENSQYAFLTEEARRAHVQEEHVKPRENPVKYLFDVYGNSLGLDASGKPTLDSTGAVPSLPAPPSRPGQTPVEAPMSRGPSMKRHESAAGSGLKPANMVIKGEEGLAPQKVVTEVPLFGTIDPQDLFQNLGGLHSGGGGAISDMNVYRSVTPNDTPESSKDSASSEPNSDVSDGVSLNVTLDMGFDTWQPFDGDQFVNFATEVNLDMLEANNVSFANDSGFTDMPLWDEMQTDFTKPFSLDTSLYAFDTSS